MPDGRRLGEIMITKRNDAVTRYRVREHREESQPPDYIDNCQTLSRELFHNGERIPFYKGVKGKGRVTFKHAGVWCFIDQRHNKHVTNLFESLFVVKNEKLPTYEYSTTPEFNLEISKSPFFGIVS